MKDVLAVGLAAAGGFLVWALSPQVVGEVLPWDASWPYYSLVMGLTGITAALFSRRGWTCTGAAWIGQVAALVVLPLDRKANMLGVSAWWALGVVSTGVGALVLGAGFAIGRLARAWLARREASE